MIKILYGIENSYLDITKKVVFCKRDKEGKNYIIPSNDLKRSELFGDPAYGFVKNIIIIKEKRGINDIYTVKTYSENQQILIDREEYLCLL